MNTNSVTQPADDTIADGLVPPGSKVGSRGAAYPDSSWALIAFALGLLSFAYPIIGFAGIVFGILARRDIRRTGERGDTVALVGLVLSIISSVLVLGYIAGMLLPPGYRLI